MFIVPSRMSKNGIIVGDENNVNKTVSGALTEFASTKKGRAFLTDIQKRREGKKSAFYRRCKTSK